MPSSSLLLPLHLPPLPPRLASSSSFPSRCPPPSLRALPPLVPAPRLALPQLRLPAAATRGDGEVHRAAGDGGRAIPIARCYEAGLARLEVTGVARRVQAVVAAAAADGGAKAEAHLSAGSEAMVMEAFLPEAGGAVSTRVILQAKEVKEKATKIKKDFGADFFSENEPDSESILAMALKQVVMEKLSSFRLEVFSPGPEIEFILTMIEFEYSVTNLESSLTIEKRQHEASVAELAEAQGKIEELLSEVGNTDEKSALLQTTVQRLEERLTEKDALSTIERQVIFPSFHGYRLEERLTEKDALSTIERQESEATKKLLDEVQGKNEELLKKLEDTENNFVHYQDTTKRTVQEIAKPIIAENTAKYKIDSVEFEAFTLGSLPPTFQGMKVYVTDEKELIMEPALKWAANPNVTVVAKAYGLKAAVQIVDLQVFASPRITLKPLVSTFPCFANILVSLMEKPHVDFGLKVFGADLMAIPVLYKFIQVPVDFSISSSDGKLLSALAEAIFSCVIEDTEKNYIGGTGGLFQVQKLNCSSDSTVCIHRIYEAELSNNTRRYLERFNLVKSSHEVGKPKNAWWPAPKYRSLNEIGGPEFILWAHEYIEVLMIKERFGKQPIASPFKPEMITTTHSASTTISQEEDIPALITINSKKIGEQGLEMPDQTYRPDLKPYF